MNIYSLRISTNLLSILLKIDKSLIKDLLLSALFANFHKWIVSSNNNNFTRTLNCSIKNVVNFDKYSFKRYLHKFIPTMNWKREYLLICCQSDILQLPFRAEKNDGGNIIWLLSSNPPCLSKPICLYLLLSTSIN